MMTRHESTAGTGKQDKKETASGTESCTESGTVCAMAQTTALKAGSPADSILELYFEESLSNIISVPILFCSRKARQPEGSAFLCPTGRLLFLTASRGIGFHFGAKPERVAIALPAGLRKVGPLLHPAPYRAFSYSKNDGYFGSADPAGTSDLMHEKILQG